jgi:hypothetical protein
MGSRKSLSNTTVTRHCCIRTRAYRHRLHSNTSDETRHETRWTRCSLLVCGAAVWCWLQLAVGSQRQVSVRAGARCSWCLAVPELN